MSKAKSTEVESLRNENAELRRQITELNNQLVKYQRNITFPSSSTTVVEEYDEDDPKFKEIYSKKLNKIWDTHIERCVSPLIGEAIVKISGEYASNSDITEFLLENHKDTVLSRIDSIELAQLYCERNDIRYRKGVYIKIIESYTPFYNTCVSSTDQVLNFNLDSIRPDEKRR